MRLASTTEVREAARPRLVQLLRRVDSSAYTALLAERGLLTLLGSRAIGLAPEAVDDTVRSRVESERREARLRALMLETTLRRVVKALEEAGVATLPIKGTTLADRVHGDTGLRPTTDVDVLVSRARIRRRWKRSALSGIPPLTIPSGPTASRRCTTRSGTATPLRLAWSCIGASTRPSGASPRTARGHRGA